VDSYDALHETTWWNTDDEGKSVTAMAGEAAERRRKTRSNLTGEALLPSIPLSKDFMAVFMPVASSR
jgi:hypothetical protein